MNKTKRGFLLAGGILGIISAVGLMLLALILMFVSTVVTPELIGDAFKDTMPESYSENADGSYIITIPDDNGEDLVITEEQLTNVWNVVSHTIDIIGVVCMVFGVAELIVSIQVVNRRTKQKYKKGYVITLLVFSVLTGTLLVLAFMIVALCLKDPEVTIENVEQIAKGQ